MDDRVSNFFKAKGLPLQALFTGEDTSTVQKAAEVLGVQDGQIAKSLALRLPTALAPAGVGVLVVMGTARLDNPKYKAAFHTKAKMLSAEETLAETGFPVGGVCPFALPEGVAVFLDESLKQYDEVYPAAGTRDSAVKVEVARLAEYTGGQWVDVCKEAGAQVG
ncbi:YbaK/EbsC family protein [Ruminococcaceae bacterium OttesenSCG-928-O06]|nr:YbaK/EbsC family protein [Ruminococcaceae bacterium OttesenSCG-928-O06]